MSNTSNSRRKFLKTAAVGTAAVASGTAPVFAHEAMTAQVPLRKGSKLTITPNPEATVFKPLDEITIDGFKKGTLQIIDGSGNLFLSQNVEAPFTYKIGGGLGIQSVLLLGKKNEIEDWTSYKVDAKTEINDKGDRYKKLMSTLYWSMVRYEKVDLMRYNDEFYEFFVCWLRDHVHAMKGMKYFYPNLKSAIELYAKYQRADGMIYDNIYYREQGARPHYFEKVFTPGNFIEVSDDGWYELKRIPVENDVEYLFLEGLYYTWKATGDTEWMKGLLNKALKAVEYSTNDPYRWSEKYNLLKRGHTIDTWDFQSTITRELTGGNVMLIDKDKTKFGVMHGDNTGMAAGLSYLVEMLEVAGRGDDAKRMKKLESDIRERLDRLSWNGEFFRHHVPEDDSFDYSPLGTNPEAQVSLSNSYALNRGIDHEQAVAIIRTYQRIRQEMPKSSPGEWYTIYPPFESGFGGHSDKWDYMNGGVITITAGELAHGAFEHGYEAYGVDILNRIAALAHTTQNYLYCTYRGAMPDMPVRNFTPLSLANVANGDIKATDGSKVRGWLDDDPKNDLRNHPVGRQTYNDIPFEVVDPTINNRKCCLLLSHQDGGFKDKITLPVNKKSASVYFLHAAGRALNAGTITLEYADGTSVVDYMDGSKLANWYQPADKKSDNCRLGWWGANEHFGNVGSIVYGYNNPNPDKEIKSIHFESFKNGSTWGILGVTLCDSPVFFMPDTVSFGIPDNWGAGAVTYALIEGLAGVKDAGISFNKVRFAPRWEAAGIDEVDATVKYESSCGYVSYKYGKRGKNINILLTGNGEAIDAEILLPGSNPVKSVTVNSVPQQFTIKMVEKSAYCCFAIEGISVKDIQITLA